MGKLVPRLVVAALAIVLPAWSWLDGTGSLAWTMFSKSGSYRLRVIATLGDGREEVVPAHRLALAAGVDARRYLARGDRWTYAPVAPTLRPRLPDLARLGCTLAPGATSVEAVMDERRSLDSPVDTRASHVTCGEASFARP
jgi:hypothetical protein